MGAMEIWEWGAAEWREMRTTTTETNSAAIPITFGSLAAVKIRFWICSKSLLVDKTDLTILNRTTPTLAQILSGMRCRISSTQMGV